MSVLVISFNNPKKQGETMQNIPVKDFFRIAEETA